jgi:hypothetical protein
LPQGQIWEHALEHCRQLAHQYEEELVDYYAMADLRSEQTSLCEGEEPNHTSARKPDPLFIIQYSLFTLHGQDYLLIYTEEFLKICWHVMSSVWILLVFFL